MFNRPHYIALSVVLSAVLIVLNLPSQPASKAKLAFGTLFIPLFGLTSSAHGLVDRGGGLMVSRRALAQQLEQTQRDNDQLRIMAMQGQEALKENDHLRQLLGIKAPPPWKFKAARVIGRDPANWWRTVQIDLGSRDGMRTDFAVLTGAGLVGRISGVSLNYSQVVLVGDSNCRVSAMVQETRENGIINYNSSSVLNPTLVNLTCFSRSSQLKAGQTVVTSGIGGVFPKGIRIGEIMDYRTVDYGLYVEARVKLSVNPNQLEEVLVLVP